MYQYKETVLKKSSADLGSGPLHLSIPLPDYTPVGQYEQVEDAEDKHFIEHVATAGGLVSRAKAPTSITWKIFKQNKLLELEVVELENQHQQQTRKVLIESPLAFRSNCVSVVSDSEDDAIVVDYITTNGFLYTIKVPISEFVHQDSTKLTNTNASAWRSIKSPYSFDMKPPHIMHAPDSRTLVVALKDGNLIKMNRDNALGIINTSFLQDSQGMSFSKLLPWNHTDKVPGRHDLSVRTALSMSSKDGILAAVSINRILKLWDLASESVLHEVDIGDKEQLLDPSPSRLVSFCGDYLATYSPLEDGKFKIWSKDLELLQETNAMMPDKTAVWTAADLQLVAKSDALKLWVVWRSDTSSFVQSLRLPFKGSMEPWLVAQPGDAPLEGKFTKVDSQDESEYYLNKIFGPGGVSFQTLRTALPVYAQSFSLQLENTNLDSIPKLRQAVCQTVGAAVSMNSDGYGYNDYKGYRQDLSLQWIRFERLCNELERQGQEALALGCTGRNEVFVVKASFVSSIRPLNPLEVYYYNRSSNPSAALVNQVSSYTQHDKNMAESVLKIMEFMRAFRTGVSHSVMANLESSLKEDYMRVRHNFATEERIVEFYEEHFAQHLSEYNIGILATQFTELEDVDTVLQVISRLIEGEEPKPTSKSTKPTFYGAEMLCKSLFETSRVAYETTLDMLSLIVIASMNDDFVQEETTAFARHIEQFRSVSCINSAFSFSKHAQSFMELLVMDVPLMRSPDQLWHELIKPTTPAQLSVQLEQLGFNSREFVNEFVKCDYFGVFIRGVLQKEEHWLCKAAVGVSKPNCLTASQRSIALKVSPTLQLESGLAAYYESVAKCVTESQPLLALRLVKLAMQTQDPESEFSPAQSWFEIALVAHAFDDAYAALIELHQMGGTVDAQIEALVTTMVKHGQAPRLCSYPFIGMKSQVNAILERNHDNNIVYAWKVEHNDMRGAAAALYNEVQRLRAIPGGAVTQHDKIRDLYETVLTSLGAVSKADDRWIVVEGIVEHQETAKRAKNLDTRDSFRAKRRALTYKDVVDEYKQFVSGLEGQLKQLII